MVQLIDFCVLQMVQGIDTALYGTCRSALSGKMNTASRPPLTGIPGRGVPGFPGSKGEKGNVR